MRKNDWKPVSRIAALTATLLVAACGGGGGGSEAPQGTVRMALIDEPSCGYDHVWVTIEKVRLHKSDSAGEGEGGWEEIVLATPKRVDLLDKVNGVVEELGQAEVPAGSYNQVRLVLAENKGNSQPYANAVHPTGGVEVPLRTPSAQQSGLKLKSKFDVEADGLADLVLDFDACRSIVVAGNSGDYNLKPVLTLSKRVQTGIQGYVSTTMTMNTTVSAQQNGVVVRSTVPDTNGKFTLPFLASGSYDVVINSDGRATAVLTSVPVTTTTTVVNGTATAFLPPTSTMREITGTASSGTGTATLVTSAYATATQQLTAGPTVHIAARPVNATDATYTLRLPAGAPVKAAYAAGSTPSFAADGTAAGKYKVRGTAEGFAAVVKDADISAADQVVNLEFAP
jgi:hypothetical protein